jgi:ParB family chromosome partitioning protein
MGKKDALRQDFGGNVQQSIASPGRVDPPAAGVPGPASARRQGVTKFNDTAVIEVARIIRDPKQPREEFDQASLEQLAASMKSRGQLQPVRVRWDEAQGLYVMIAGERRLRAAQLAGLATIRAEIHQGEPSPGERLVIQLIENCLREDLSGIEQARAFRALMDENGWSMTQLAKELSITQPAITQALKLLDLPEPVRAQVEQGKLAPATAYEVSKLEDPEEQVAVAARAVAEGKSRTQVRDEVRQRSGRQRAGHQAKFTVGECTVTVAAPRNDPRLITEALEGATRQAAAIQGSS